jgi:hypothetical protein
MSVAAVALDSELSRVAANAEWVAKVEAMEESMRRYYASYSPLYPNHTCWRCTLKFSSAYYYCPVCGASPSKVPTGTKPVVVGLPTEDKARKRLKLFTYLMEYFPDSFIAEAEVAIQGNEQHNPGEPLHWARDKSTDQLNTAFRHLFDYGRGVKKDTDGQYHLAKAIWRQFGD